VFNPAVISRKAIVRWRTDDSIGCFHLASYGVRPRDCEIEPMFRVNVEATRRIVETAAGWSPQAVVIAGSGSEYRLDGVERPVTEIIRSSRLSFTEPPKQPGHCARPPSLGLR
jgi:nucleoside-diphosphate-sugar epimerase